jgi:hypothetical protein
MPPIFHRVALGLEDIVRKEGVTPATIALADGQIRVGLSHQELERIAAPDSGSMKVSLRDMANCLVQKVNRQIYFPYHIQFLCRELGAQRLRPQCGLPIGRA